ncbi:tRNA (guanine(37)-N(1))-methyltransferase isoform X1 [Ciona intestinalis]
MVIAYIRNLLRKVIQRGMDHEHSSLYPPAAVRGMKVLDRSAFEQEVTLPALLVPVQSLRNCRKMMKSKLVNLSINKKVVDPPVHLVGEELTTGHKLFLLKPGTTMETYSSEEKQTLSELGVKDKIYDYRITLGYENYKHWDVLRAILPDSEMAARGFSQVGHILHVNLRDHQLPYKNIIGQVLLDKIQTARTVVNKHQNIDNKFRNFEMEVIAGENNFITRIVEHGRKFEFDFSKVFWNSRLSTEHQRISHLVSESDVVFDVFAGVGPFAIPIAKKGCVVYANDLNPESYRWLLHNVALNKTKAKCFNSDGREFIKTELRNYLLTRSPHKVHVLMNLPAIAVEFLDVFRGLLCNGDCLAANDLSNASQKELLSVPEVCVHLYIFAPEKDGIADLKSRIKQSLGCALPEEVVIYDVRNVAPKKQMYCVSFILSQHLMDQKEQDVYEPAPKKLKECVS